MIDGETDTGSGCDVGRVRNFLKIGFDGNGKRKEEVIDDIESCCDTRVLHESIGCKDDDKTGILENQCPAIANHSNEFSNPWREQHIDAGVDQEQQRDRRHVETEFLDHKKTREDDENLAPCAGQKHQHVVQPVASAQDQLAVLSNFFWELRKQEPAGDTDDGSQSAAQHVDNRESKIKAIKQNPNQCKSDN